jgi:hypothetical protein
MVMQQASLSEIASHSLPPHAVEMGVPAIAAGVPSVAAGHPPVMPPMHPYAARVPQFIAPAPMYGPHVAPMMSPGGANAMVPQPMLEPAPQPQRVTVERGCQKKTRLVWTPELHTRFLFAVEQIGLRTAVPRTILQARI